MIRFDQSLIPPKDENISLTTPSLKIEIFKYLYLKKSYKYAIERKQKYFVIQFLRYHFSINSEKLSIQNTIKNRESTLIMKRNYRSKTIRIH